MLDYGMALPCNIDSRGKRVRLIYGVVLVIVGAFLTLFWAIPSNNLLPWLISLLTLLGGAFALFEARAGWCVLRALGFKTPL